MENLTETITEKRTQNGEGHRRDVIREQKFWTAKISWPAILAGVLVTTVSQILLSLLGVGIGLSTVDPLSEADPGQGLGAGSIAWWSVTMLGSLFLGGWTTGKMYVPKLKGDLTMHGLLTWATFTVFSFLMLATSVGKLVSGGGNLVGSALTAGASAAGNDKLDISKLTNDARNILLQSPKGGNVNGATGGQPRGTSDNAGVGNTQPTTNTDVTGSTMSDVNNPQIFINSVETFFKGGDIENPDTREAMVNSLVNQTGMSRAEANTKVDQWIKTYADIKAKAIVAADKAAKVASTAAIIGFFALIIGALVTMGGARFAQRKNLIPVRA